jgi:Phage terminase, small subunit
MSEASDRPTLSIVPPENPGANSAGASDRSADPLPPELPKAQAELTEDERRVWLYVGKALREAGLLHRTDAIVLTVIVRTFCSWLGLEAELAKYQAEHGTLIKHTEKGYPVMHPLFYAAQTEKKALLQWLPEAALTIPSYQKAIAAADPEDQGDLFGDALELHTRSKPRLV